MSYVIVIRCVTGVRHMFDCVYYVIIVRCVTGVTCVTVCVM